MLKSTLAAFSIIGLLAAAPVFAASAPKVPAAPAATPDKPDAPDAKTIKSKECSTMADKKGLHGKARKKFRAECKKAA
jgi:hypothetical protein